MQFRVRPVEIVSEMIDGEVIIIDMRSGIYYSLRGSAPRMWQQLEKGASVESLRQTLCHHYDGSDEEFDRASRDFIECLAGHGIIEPFDDAATSVASGEIPTSRTPFSPPVLETYSDVQDLLLIDPVHEVTDAGWPHRPGGD